MRLYSACRDGAVAQPLSVGMAQLLELFGSIRDKWMSEDLPGWLGANRFYPGEPACLAQTYVSSAYHRMTDRSHATASSEHTCHTLPHARSGIPEATMSAFANPKGKVYIVTTKQVRTAKAEGGSTRG